MGVDRGVSEGSAVWLGTIVELGWGLEVLKAITINNVINKSAGTIKIIKYLRLYIYFQ